VPPHATYLFKHALVHGRGLWHAAARAETRASRRIAEALEKPFAEIAESQPELLAGVIAPRLG